MNKTLKITVALVPVIFLPFFISIPIAGFCIFYFFFLEKGKNKDKKLDADSGITEYNGLINEVGETNLKEGLRLETMYQPTFIQIDYKEYRGLEYPTELSSLFHKATYKESTLYVYEKTIIGIKIGNGRTYSVNYHRAAQKIFLGWVFILLGIPLIAALGIGFLSIGLGIMMRKQGKIFIKARYIPDALELN